MLGIITESRKKLLFPLFISKEIKTRESEKKTNI